MKPAWLDILDCLVEMAGGFRPRIEDCSLFIINQSFELRRLSCVASYHAGRLVGPVVDLRHSKDTLRIA